MMIIQDQTRQNYHPENNLREIPTLKIETILERVKIVSRVSRN